MVPIRPEALFFRGFLCWLSVRHAGTALFLVQAFGLEDTR
jgi:hypothetical protein